MELINITAAEREWLREASEILKGKDASPLVRKKAASFVRLIADRDLSQRDKIRQ